MSQLWLVPAHDLARRVRSGAISPVEPIGACLARMDQTNPLLNAFIAMHPQEAFAEARATADEIARGEDPGPLAGLPLRVKELEDAEGFPSTHASVPFNDSWPREIPPLTEE